MGDFWKSFAGLKVPIEAVSELQTDYVKQATELWNQTLSRAQPERDAKAAPPAPLADSRFAAPDWAANPAAAYTAQMYLLNARTLMQLAESSKATPRRARACASACSSGSTRMSPANFMALNPEAQKKALETKGESIAQGLRSCWNDLQQGHVSQTDESVFEVGRNVATTEGAVVFENELFQLIEYKPLTRQGPSSGRCCSCRRASTSSTSSTCSPRTR